ncbi:MAG: ABC transporter permease [Firmicutes bacterium]|nr:ABC transporter permease [Bacillota bacterium]
MITFIRKFLLCPLVTFFILTFMIFIIAHTMPGDPLYSIYGDSAKNISKLQRENIIKNMGLNKPLLVQYKGWINNVFKGKLGKSFKYGVNVINIIKKALNNTLFLTIIILIFIIILSLLLGIICALNEGNLLDYIITKVGTFLYCIPAFWLALVFILIFSVKLNIFPSSGVYDIGKEGNFLNKLKHTILPSSVIIIGHIGYYSNFIRNKVLEEIKNNYVILAKSKGISRKEILIKHILKNIMPSFIILISTSLNHIIGGSLVIEYIFSYPGIGKYIFESAKFHDYPLLMGCIVIIGFLVILVNISAELVSVYLDPRIIEE